MQTLELCGRSSHHGTSYPSQELPNQGRGPGAFSYVAAGCPPAINLLQILLYEKTVPCSWYSDFPFIAKVCALYDTWPVSHYNTPQERDRVFTCSRRGACKAHCPTAALRRKLLAMGHWHIPQMLILLCPVPSFCE